MEWVPILLLGALALVIAIVALRLPREGWMLFAAVLIFGAGLAIELGLRMVKNEKYKSLIIIGVILLAILLFMEMAVGIFGSPIAGEIARVPKAASQAQEGRQKETEPQRRSGRRRRRCRPVLTGQTGIFR